MRINHKQIILDSFFDGDEDLAGDFLAAFKSVGLKTGQTLIAAGDESDDVFVLVTGQLKAQIHDLHDNSLWLADFHPGDIIGEMAALGQHKRSASVVAVGNARVYKVSAAVFIEIMELNGRLATRVARAMAERLRQTTRRIWETSVLKIKGRVHAELIRRAEQQGRDTWPAQGPEIIVDNIQSFADHICCPRENVSRAIKNLTDEGHLVRLDGKRLRLKLADDYEFPTVQI